MLDTPWAYLPKVNPQRAREKAYEAGFLQAFRNQEVVKKEHLYSRDVQFSGLNGGADRQTVADR